MFAWTKQYNGPAYEKRGPENYASKDLDTMSKLGLGGKMTVLEQASADAAAAAAAGSAAGDYDDDDDEVDSDDSGEGRKSKSAVKARGRPMRAAAKAAHNVARSDMDSEHSDEVRHRGRLNFSGI